MTAKKKVGKSWRERTEPEEPKENERYDTDAYGSPPKAQMRRKKEKKDTQFDSATLELRDVPSCRRLAAPGRSTTWRRVVYPVCVTLLT